MLERLYNDGIDSGGRVRERLRDGVHAGLVTLGSAFIRGSRGQLLESSLASGALTPEGYYRELLRLVYRLLFLFVAEERKLVSPPDADPARYDSVYDELRKARERKDPVAIAEAEARQRQNTQSRDARIAAIESEREDQRQARETAVLEQVKAGHRDAYLKIPGTSPESFEREWPEMLRKWQLEQMPGVEKEMERLKRTGMYGS